MKRNASNHPDSSELDPCDPPPPMQVPEGATPRTMSVHLRGEVCRSMKPGDEVILSGIFLPEPYSGFKAMR